MQTTTNLRPANIHEAGAYRNELMQERTKKHWMQHAAVSSTLAAALCTLLPLDEVKAELPSVSVLVNFTGSQEGGGNGALPVTTTLSEAADGYLYSRTIWGGGTEATMQTSTGLYGGRVSVFYRIRNDGTDFEVLTRTTSDAALPSYNGGWLAADDGYLYAPGGRNRVLMRYLPGSGADWTSFGTYSSSTDMVDVVAQSNGRFIVTRLSGAFRAISADGETQTTLVSQSSLGRGKGTNPHFMKTDTDGTMYGVFSSGGSGVFSLSSDGSTLKQLCTYSSNGVVGGYNNGPYRPIVIRGDYIYGVTWGGTLAGGVFWRLRKDGDGTEGDGPVGCPSIEILHSFSTGAVLGGNNPDNLVLGQDGNIYGISNGGVTLDGKEASGTIWRYRFVEDGENVLEVLHAFSSDRPDPPRNNIAYVNGAPVASPVNIGANAGGYGLGTLAQARSGQFFGTTQLGGSYGWGTLFRFNPGDEVAPGSALTAAPPQVIMGINSLNASYNRYTLAVGGRVSLYWKGVYAAGCVASSNDPDSAWSGERPATAATMMTAERINAEKVGTWTYTLTCQPQSSEFTEPVSATVTVDVVPLYADTEDIGNGGGAWGGAGLPLLAWLAWRRRRSGS